MSTSRSVDQLALGSTGSTPAGLRSRLLRRGMLVAVVGVPIGLAGGVLLTVLGVRLLLTGPGGEVVVPPLRPVLGGLPVLLVAVTAAVRGVGGVADHGGDGLPGCLAATDRPGTAVTVLSGGSPGSRYLTRETPLMTRPVVQVRDVFVAYQGAAGSVMALRGSDLTLALGERLLVQGPNGSGKTTLLRVITGGAASRRRHRRGVGHRTCTS